MLPKELLSARFKGLAPSAKALVMAAEQLSGMELRLDGKRVEFVALPGAGVEVLCNPRRRRVSIRHEGNKSPTLYLLLQHAIARLGGDIKPGELPYPLTEAAVRKRDRLEQRGLAVAVLGLLVRAPVLLIRAAFGKSNAERS